MYPRQNAVAAHHCARPGAWDLGTGARVILIVFGVTKKPGRISDLRYHSLGWGWCPGIRAHSEHCAVSYAEHRIMPRHTWMNSQQAPLIQLRPLEDSSSMDEKISGASAFNISRPLQYRADGFFFFFLPPLLICFGNWEVWKNSLVGSSNVILVNIGVVPEPKSRSLPFDLWGREEPVLWFMKSLTSTLMVVYSLSPWAQDGWFLVCRGAVNHWPGF